MWFNVETIADFRIVVFSILIKQIRGGIAMSNPTQKPTKQQQAINILLMSRLQLSQFLSQQLEENPLLEAIVDEQPQLSSGIQASWVI